MPNMNLPDEGKRLCRAPIGKEPDKPFRMILGGVCYGRLRSICVTATEKTIVGDPPAQVGRAPYDGFSFKPSWPQT